MGQESVSDKRQEMQALQAVDRLSGNALSRVCGVTECVRAGEMLSLFWWGSYYFPVFAWTVPCFPFEHPAEAETVGITDGISNMFYSKLLFFQHIFCGINFQLNHKFLDR